MNIDKNAVVELLKSFGRFIYFGVLGLVVTFLTSLAADPSLAQAHVTVAGQTFSIGFVLVAAIAFAAKAIDRYVHKSENTDLKGIAPSFLQR